MLAKQVDFNQVTQFYKFPLYKVVKKRLWYLNRSLKYWLNKILSQLLWRLIGKRQINRGILSNFCCLLGKPKHFYGFSFSCEFFAKKFKKVKQWQGYLPGLGRNKGVFCPNKLKIWFQAVQGSSIAWVTTYTWSSKFSRYDTNINNLNI